MEINKNNVYELIMASSAKMLDPKVKRDSLKLYGNKKQIEYWKSIYKDSVEYIELPIIK